MTMHRVLVRGHRNYSDKARVFSVLDHYLRKAGGFDVLIHGAATGADSLAGEWAAARAVRVLTYPADWSMGPIAGPIRNAQMLREGKPTLVIAFPGGRGTENMVERAKRAKVPVLEIPA